MPVQHIDHVNIRAPKALVSKMKDFYEGVIGLHAGWRPPFKSTGHWLYAGDSPIIHLVDDEAVQGSGGPRGPVIDHVSLSCSGLPEFVAWLEARGIVFRRAEVLDATIAFCQGPRSCSCFYSTQQGMVLNSSLRTTTPDR